MYETMWINFYAECVRSNLGYRFINQNRNKQTGGGGLPWLLHHSPKEVDSHLLRQEELIGNPCTCHRILWFQGMRKEISCKIQKTLSTKGALDMNRR